MEHYIAFELQEHYNAYDDDYLISLPSKMSFDVYIKLRSIVSVEVLKEFYAFCDEEYLENDIELLGREKDDKRTYGAREGTDVTKLVK